jgi:adenosylhomocysteine nucleosidase
MVSRAWLCQDGRLRARIAIVAAMAGELKPLVRGWKREVTPEGVTVFLSEHAIAALAGLGAERARLAAKTALAAGPIRRIVSAGWAGGLHAGMEPGGVWRIREVVNSATGEIVETSDPHGMNEDAAVLVTAETVTSAHDKRQMHTMYSADLVDMEAAAVADVARKHRLPFSAIKAVSDGYDFDLPGMEKFTTADGQFRQGLFAAYAVLRPTLWKPVAQLARDSRKAATNLAEELKRIIAEESE